MLWSHLRPPILLVILLMEHLCDSPVTAYDIQAATQKDPLLSKVLQYVSRGWPENNMGGADLSPFFTRRTELSLQGGCILWGSRVIVAFRHRKAVLEELHEAHPGMTRMKSLARMFVWWPGIDRDTERIVQLCRECQTSLSSPTLQPWKWPTHPWSRLHIDYAGPMYGKMCLIIVDVHSKWIEAGLFPRQLQLLPLNYSAIHSLALNFLISGCCQCTLLRQ